MIVKQDAREQCRQELWNALGFPSDQLPTSNWEAALEAVRQQTRQLGDVRKIVR